MMLSQSILKFFRPIFGTLILIAALGTNLPAAWSASDLAPDFREVDLSGKTHTLQDYKGKILVLYFWATWCPYCRQDVSSMIEVHQKFNPRGVEFLSVSMDQDESKLRKFVAKHNLPYPVSFRGVGWGHPLAELYGLSGIPTYVIVDQEGKVIDSDVGAEALGNSLSQMA